MSYYDIKGQILDCEVKVFFPDKFKKLFEFTDRHSRELERSFRNDKCEEILQKIKEKIGDGGASGELFLSSINKKFLIKTISYTEGKVFNRLIDDMGFIEFFEDNPYSSIAKIWGY